MVDIAISTAGLGFFQTSLVFAVLTFIASYRAQNIGWFLVLYFALGWLVSELAWLVGAANIVIGLCYINKGALATSTGILALLISVINLFFLFRLHRLSHACADVYKQSLEASLGKDFQKGIEAQRLIALRTSVTPQNWLRPFKMRLPGVDRISGLSYGPLPRHRLDLYRPSHLPEQACPVILHIHGGAWMVGQKKQQAQPLINHMTSRGWICIDINYRLSPRHRMPDHIVDVKRALTWIKQEIAYYGGNPNFIIATGGSAGGHLSSLLTLSANKTQNILQPGFEDKDTSVNACIAFYGVYDFLSRDLAHDNGELEEILTDRVMPASSTDAPELWDTVSPITHIYNNSPNIMIIHGSHDSLVPVEGARLFAKKLKDTSKNKVIYAEIPGAQHAFEMFHSVRTEHTLNAVSAFAEYCYQQYHNEIQTPAE